MTITIKFDDINYGDVIVRAKPILLREAENYRGDATKTMVEIAKLPKNLIYKTFDELSVEKRNELVREFTTESKDLIVSVINTISERNQVGVVISDLSITRDLEMVVVVDEIDYPCVVELFLPKIREKLLSMGKMAVLLRPVIEGASAAKICGLMDQLFGDKKDSFVASVVNQNQGRVIGFLEAIAQKLGIRAEIDSVFIQIS